MNNVMFTNVRNKNGESLGGEIDNVMVFTNLTAEQLEAAFRANDTLAWDDCFPVSGEELQFYLYDPCHLTEEEEKVALDLAKAAQLDPTFAELASAE